MRCPRLAGGARGGLLTSLNSANNGLWGTANIDFFFDSGRAGTGHSVHRGHRDKHTVRATPLWVPGWVGHKDQ